jgi:hypothetical protein
MNGDATTVTIGGYQIAVGAAEPDRLAALRRHAELADDFPLADEAVGDNAGFLFVAVSDGNPWPGLVITQRYSPSGAGFTPGVLLIDEPARLFLGAGTRLLSYERSAGRWRRSWTDQAECGFWQWRQHHGVVLMSAELELAAWDTEGTKLWTTFVEPPWTYQVDADHVDLDVMGLRRSFDLRRGP